MKKIAVIAASVGTNPVVVRRLVGELKKAGLATVRAGVGGLVLARDPAKISLLDIFGAIEGADVFKIHANSSEACPLGRQIAPLLAERFGAAQKAMRKKLAKTTLADLLSELK